MGFINYNIKYYRKQIKMFENSEANKDKVYLAKQLLKQVYDFYDEGYSDLYDYLSEEDIVNRLDKYIKDNNETPFNRIKELDLNNLNYDNKELELNSYLNTLLINNKSNENNEFINELKGYCKYIDINTNNAYIFLLRDTLLPYLYFLNKGYKNIYPYLISRKLLEDINKIEDSDDEFREIINEALENDIEDFDSFVNYCIPRFRIILNKYPLLEKVLKELLNNIKEDKIIVIESGLYGTFPMLLKLLDNRIDFKLFTTIPSLFNVYKDKIYTTRYELNREFETLYAQQGLFKLAKYNKTFYVYTCLDKDIINKSYKEIANMLDSKE